MMMPPGPDLNVDTFDGYRTGLVVRKELREKYPKMRLACCSLAKDKQAIEWFTENASGTISKLDPDALVDAVNRIVFPRGKRKWPKSFIVHGHDEKTLLDVKNYVQNVLGFPQPIVLREQPSLGKTVIEKFNDYAGEVDLVFVLLTPDDDNRLTEGALGLLPRSLEPTVKKIAGEIDEVLGAFIRGQLMVMLALGLTYALGLWLIGLDLAFIIGAGAGLLSIVPYLGTLVGVVAALIAAFFQFQDVLHPVLVLAVFAAGQSLEGMVFTPKLVGDRICLHPVTVIFSVLAGGQLFGFLGILLALPVAAALNVLVRHLREHYHRSDLYTRQAQQPEDA